MWENNKPQTYKFILTKDEMRDRYVWVLTVFVLKDETPYFLHSSRRMLHGIINKRMVFYVIFKEEDLWR